MTHDWWIDTYRPYIERYNRSLTEAQQDALLSILSGEPVEEWLARTELPQSGDGIEKQGE